MLFYDSTFDPPVSCHPRSPHEQFTYLKCGLYAMTIAAFHDTDCFTLQQFGRSILSACLGIRCANDWVSFKGLD